MHSWLELRGDSIRPAPEAGTRAGTTIRRSYRAPPGRVPVSLRPTWYRRAGALWAGILAAGAAVVVVVYLRFPDVLVPGMVGTAVVAVLVGVIGTVRFRKQDHEPLITVKDLRQR